jgi:hypothetical protein
MGLACPFQTQNLLFSTKWSGCIYLSLLRLPSFINFPSKRAEGSKLERILCDVLPLAAGSVTANGWEYGVLGLGLRVTNDESERRHELVVPKEKSTLYMRFSNTHILPFVAKSLNI